MSGTASPIQVAVDVDVEVHDDDAHVAARQARSRSSTAPSSPPPQQSSSPRKSFCSRLCSAMSLPRANYDPRRVCLNPFPEFTLGKHRRTVGVYISGALFALASWTFFDAAILSKHARLPWGDEDTPIPVHVTFLDWLPGISSFIGFLIINLIDKDRIKGEDGFGDSRAVWRARLFLFIGFALMAGGLAGSVCVLVLKYVMNDYSEQFKYYGYANVSQNVAMMLSAVVLWIAQNTSSEYEYNLTL